jgi:hypothetical protein
MKRARRRTTGSTMLMRVPEMREKYPDCCVPVAIAAWSGKSIEETTATVPGTLGRGCYPFEVLEMIEKSGLPLLYSLSFTGGRVAKELPLMGRGIAWVHRVGCANRHLIAFDGKIVLDAMTLQPTWVYDHPCAEYKIDRLFLLPEATT